MNATTNDGLRTFKVPAHALATVRAALAKAYAGDCRHAARAGHPAPAAPDLVVGEPVTVRECSWCHAESAITDLWMSACCNKPAHLRTYVLASVTAPRPTVGAWELVAVVEAQPLDFEGKPSPNLIRCVPGAMSLDESVADSVRWGDATRCDHCAVDRRRLETFLVRGEDGAIKQIGRTCLEAFLGGDSYELIARRLFWERALTGGDGEEEGGGGGSWGVAPPDIETVLALTACVIRNDGWVPKSKAGDGEQSTAGQVEYLMNPPFCGEGREFWAREVARLAPQPSDMAHAMTALAWVRDLAPRNDYEWAIHTAGRLAKVEHMGIVCSIVSAYDRVIGRQTAQRIARAALPPSQHLGAVGDKVSVTGLVERASAHEGQYGTTTLIVVVAETGTVVQWWKSGIVDEVIAGRTVTMTGKVKGHTDRDGRAVTVLTRCKLALADAASAA